jgi:hypothetical protein
MVGGSKAPPPSSLLFLAYQVAGFMNIAASFFNHHTCASSSLSIVSLISYTDFATDTPPRYYQKISNLPQPNLVGASSSRHPTSSLATTSQVINYIYFMNIPAIHLLFYLGIQYIL